MHLESSTERSQICKSKVTNEELKKQLATVQAELQSTQKALVQPKAILTLTLRPYINPPIGQPVVPVTQITRPISADGSVHVEFAVLNLTDNPAVDGELTLQICDNCKFSKEPEQFAKLAGEPDTQRHLDFTRLLPMTALESLSADIIPPLGADKISLAVQYRCKTCILVRDPPMALVYLSR